jgi:hypothetical protein
MEAKENIDIAVISIITKALAMDAISISKN